MNSIRKTGQYDKTSVTGEVVQSFVPLPLPPQNPTLAIDEDITNLLMQAEKKLIELANVNELIPSLDWFIYAFVRKEAVTSSQIEGTQATLIDLLSFEADDSLNKNENPNIEEVCNYLEAIKYARAQLNSKKGLPLSMRLLNETHKRLMHGARGGSKHPGEIRQSQNWIGGTRPSNATFVPPPPTQLPKLLSDFEKYIHNSDALPPLIRIGLLHVQFETIHPYLDGNGRIGRLLITLLLEHWGLLTAPLLYLSLYFKRNRNDYYQLLGNVRTEGDWEAWIKFFLTGVVEIANETVKLAKHLAQIVMEDNQKVLSDSSTTLFTMRLFNLLPLHPIITMPQVVQLLKTSKPTALKAIGTLEKLGILIEHTGRKRDRSFRYADYLDKLKFGTELTMYRIVINYAFEDFVIHEGEIGYAAKAKTYFFYESKDQAEKYYHKVIKKLKGTPSIRGAELQVYRGDFSDWERLQSALIWSDNSQGISTLHGSDVVTDKLSVLQNIIEVAHL